jgi:glycosyltransferase involved in cell wall biosynthesis
LVDDGSTDATAEIAGAMPGVKVLRQENSGPASARNRGIRQASGDWLAFLDADEEWLDPGKLDAQLACARRYDAVLIGTRRRAGPDTEVGLKRCLLGNPFATSSVLVEKQAALKAGCFGEGRYYSEDYLLWLTILAKGGKAALAGIAGSRDISGRAAFAAGGLSGNLSRMQAGEEDNFRSLFRRRMLAGDPFANLFWYLTALGCSRAKYIRRLAIAAARIIGRRS